MFDKLNIIELTALSDKMLRAICALDPSQPHNYPMIAELAPIQDEVSFAKFTLWKILP